MSDISRRESLANLEKTASGELAGHVWRSQQYRGADMVINFASPDTEIKPGDHGLPQAFADQVGLEYCGTISPEEAQAKITGMMVMEAAVESVYPHA